MGERAEKEAFVTLATNDTYGLGCLVLGNSLRRVQTTRKLVVMVTDGVSHSMRNQLGRIFDLIQDVNVFDSNDAVNLQLLGRPDLSCTLTKLHCWMLTQFQKCVFMDADTLVLQNVDELFDREELSAAPDAGWPDCFNSGVFVFVPSEQTYQSLVQFAMTQGTFDGGDQGLLNLFFHDWSTQDIAKHLPFTYNVVSQAFYSYLPAFTQFKDRIKIVHFIGAVKPWHHAYNTATGQVMPLAGTGHSQEFLQLWWNIFIQTVQPSLDPAIQHDVLTPFLQYEYVDHSAQTAVESVRNPEPPPQPTYQVVFPYIPPSLDQVFYSPPVHENAAHADGPWDTNGGGHYCESVVANIVELSAETVKPYLTIETHYAEEPLSHVNPDSPPKEHYGASSLESTLKESVDVAKGDSSVEPVDTSGSHGEDIPDTKIELISKSSDENSKNDVYDDNGNLKSCDHSLGGLVGELASLQLEGGVGGSQGNIVFLDDRERKLAWERGQMDYLGVDKFENIQKKLNEKMGDDKTRKASPPAETPQAETPQAGAPTTTTTTTSEPVETPAENMEPVPNSGTEDKAVALDVVADLQPGVVVDSKLDESSSPVVVLDAPDAPVYDVSVANVVLSAPPVEEHTTASVAAVAESQPVVSDTFTIEQPPPETELAPPQIAEPLILAASPAAEPEPTPTVETVTAGLPPVPTPTPTPPAPKPSDPEPAPQPAPEPTPKLAPLVTPQTSKPPPPTPAPKPTPPTTPTSAFKPAAPAPAPKPTPLTTPTSPSKPAPPAPAPKPTPPTTPTSPAKPAPPVPASKPQTPTSPATTAPKPLRPWEKPKPWEKQGAPVAAPKPSAPAPASKPAPSVPTPAPKLGAPASAPKPGAAPSAAAAPESKPEASKPAPFSRISASPFMKSAGSAATGVYAPKPWSASGTKQFGSVAGPKPGTAPAPAPTQSPTAPKPSPAAPPKPSSRFGTTFPPPKK